MMTRPLLLNATLAVTLAAVPAAAAAAGKLNIFNWGEYTSMEMIEKFEKEYDVSVTIDSYDSNETMLAKIKAGASGYDIAVPGDYMVAIMIEEDMLERVEPSQMSNYENLDDRWKNVYWDPGNHYSIPWNWGTTTFVVNTNVYKGDIHTLALLFDPPPELQGRINLLRDVNDVINAALRYLDLPRCNSNPEDLRKLMDLLMEVKPHIKSFAYESKELINSGEVDIAQIWNGFSLRARRERAEMHYAYPREGFTGWMDNLVVLKGAENLENAKLFMNFMMDPENAAMQSNFTAYANGVKGSEQYINAEILESPEYQPPQWAPEPEFVPPCGPDVVTMYDRIWTNFLK